MRLWSLDLKYLDSKGLVALWRESLLAKNVLMNKTKGYKNHPQLIRFRKEKNFLKLINTYLYFIFLEAKDRGYNFSKDKIDEKFITNRKIFVSSGQLDFEFSHLQEKLKIRDREKYKNNLLEDRILANRLFIKIDGVKEDWEKS